MTKLIISVLSYVLLALLLPASARAERIVATDFVVQAIGRSAILWDIRDAEAYGAHIG